MPEPKNRHSLFRRTMCRIGWHRPLEPISAPIDKPMLFGRTMHLGRYRCESCGKEGLVDSQGNLF